jgi:hypothetical protein
MTQKTNNHVFTLTLPGMEATPRMARTRARGVQRTARPLSDGV